MNRNSGNVSKTKKVIPGVGNNSKLDRKLFHKLSDSSSISSNRNSSAHSEEDVRVGGVYLKAQVDNPLSYEEQEQVTKKLQGQVKELRHKLRILEESIDSKDYSLGTISREKDRAMGEIRRLERSNKQLRQQLNEERNHYLEEKEKFCEEMTKYKKKLQVKAIEEKKTPNSKQSLINQSLKWQLNKEKGDFAESKTIYPELKQSKSQRLLGIKDKKLTDQSTIAFSNCQLHKRKSIESLHLYEGDDISLQTAALRTENAKLRSIICERDERNYELCLRFLRLKHYKNDIKSRFQDLENAYLQVIANLMDKIDEARQEFNFIIDQKFKRPLHSTNAMYLQMVQKNSRMAFENASLRLENQCLKKELNKYINSSTEFNDRKNNLTIAIPELDSKLTSGDHKGNGKSKRIKKNVNFQEIQTIYERDLNFKHSDTDSNYMSKTSTTVLSNGSLRDPKSSESIIEGEEINQNRTQPNFKANSLPQEILHKIFKKVDTSSCQTMDSGRSVSDVHAKSDVTERRDADEAKNQRDANQKPEPISLDVPCKEVRKEPIIIEQRISDSSSPSESKESVRIEVKETFDLPQVSPIRMNVTQKENFPTPRKQVKQNSWTFKNRLKTQVRGKWSFDRDYYEDKSGFLDFPVRRIILGPKHKIQQPKPERKVSQTQNMIRTMQYIDSCGLQEKLEFSDFELSCSATVKKQTQTIGKLEKTMRDKTKTMSTGIEMIESDVEDLGMKIEKQKAVEILTPAIGSRSRSSNKLNLQDELMEAARHQLKSDELWRKELKQQLSQSGTNIFITDKEHDNLNKNLQRVTEEPSVIPQDSIHNTQIQYKYALDTPQSHKSEGSKRFSHRLISRTPEQLRSLLTESQLESIQMAPIIVGHVTNEISPFISYEEGNSEIFLQLVVPQTSFRKISENYLNNEQMESLTVERETSMSGLNPISPAKSTNQVEICSSEIRIPVSNLATSSSTTEIVNSTAFDRGNIMMRTLSAPGLLESSWLDPYNICEMRDCGTNT